MTKQSTTYVRVRSVILPLVKMLFLYFQKKHQFVAPRKQSPGPENNHNVRGSVCAYIQQYKRITPPLNDDLYVGLSLIVANREILVKDFDA